jgi:hypothetical protein
MNRCLAAIAAVTLACAVRADPTEPIRVTASVVGKIRPGQTAIMTWTVTGTLKPVRLFLENKNPLSGVLEGGNVQTATTSGGRENVVSRQVTGLAPGIFDIAVEVDTEHETLNPKDLAVKFRSELLRIASQTKKASRRLQTEERSFVRTADVIALLDQAYDDLQRSLPYVELAAFRDAAAELVKELHREAMEKSVAGRERHDAVLLVRQEAPPAGRMPAKEAHSLLDRFVDWLTNGARLSPLRTVCVVTEPTGANVLLYPSSFPAERNETRTIGSLTLYLGLYVYEIEAGQRKSKGTINLLKDRGSVLECLGDPAKCDVRDLPREKCP